MQRESKRNGSPLRCMARQVHQALIYTLMIWTVISAIWFVRLTTSCLLLDYHRHFKQLVNVSSRLSNQLILTLVVMRRLYRQHYSIQLTNLLFNCFYSLPLYINCNLECIGMSWECQPNQYYHIPHDSSQKRK